MAKNNAKETELLLRMQELKQKHEEKTARLQERKARQEEKYQIRQEKLLQKAKKHNVSLEGEDKELPQLPKPMYTLGEEIFNSVTHGIGAVLAIAAIVLIIIKSVSANDVFKLTAGIVYGVTLFVLYLMSTLYHAITHRKAKAVFRVFDHCSIYFLIAGTYTPYLLVAMRESFWGIVLLHFVWIVSTLGIVLTSINMKKFRVFSMIAYIALGWCIVVSGKDLVASMPQGGLILLLAGGLAYTGGIVFFALHKYKYMHSIWHLFVLLGSLLHFFSLYFYVF